MEEIKDKDFLKLDPNYLLKVVKLISENNFTPPISLKEEIKNNAYLVLKIPKEKLLYELDKIIIGDYVKNALQFMYETNLLENIFPELSKTVGFEQNCEHHHKDLWEHTKLALEASEKEEDIRWTVLLHDIGKVKTRCIQNGKVHFYGHELVSKKLFKEIAQRLGFPRERKNKIGYLIANHMRPALYSSEWTDSAVRRFIKESGEYLNDLLKIARADITSQRPEKVKSAINRLNELKERITQIIEQDNKVNPLPKKIGEKIMEKFGLPEGPEVGKMKKKLIDAIDEGIIEGGKEYKYYLDYLDEIMVKEEFIHNDLRTIRTMNMLRKRNS